MQTPPIEILPMINIVRAQYVVLARNCRFFDLGFTRTKVNNNNDDYVSTS